MQVNSSMNSFPTEIVIHIFFLVVGDELSEGSLNRKSPDELFFYDPGTMERFFLSV